MKQGYKFGVEWIARNDETACLEVDEVQHFISTLLLADLFGKEPAEVAKDVVRLRLRLERLEREDAQEIALRQIEREDEELGGAS